VLRGQLGQGLGAEVGELLVCAAGAGQPLLERGDLVVETADLGRAGVGALAVVVERGQALFELGAQVGVGAVAVEGRNLSRSLRQVGN
jgi:hypothetical protein